MGNQKTKPDAVTKYKPLSQEALIAIAGIAATCYTGLAIAAMIPGFFGFIILIILCFCFYSALFLIYDHYQILCASSGSTAGKPILGTDDKSKRYMNIGKQIGAGESIGGIYERIITGLLNKVDIFYGDKNNVQRRLSKRFALQKPAALWTVESYDRSLLIAFIYPIFLCFSIWLITNQLGLAETAIGLKRLSNLERFFAAFSFLLFIISCYKLIENNGTGIWWLLSLSAFVILSIILQSHIISLFLFVFFTGAFAVAFAISFVITYAVVFLGALSFALGFSLAGDIAGAFAIAIAIAVVIIAAIVVIIAIGVLEAEHYIYIAFTILMFSIFLMIPLFSNSDESGPLLLFFGILIFVNAPFDWLTVGVTRWLLRLGLEKKGLWPIFLAIGDFIAALIFIFLLAVVTLLSVQLFGAMEILGVAGRATLATDDILMGMNNPAQRSNSQYFWIYAMLFSTMIPSLLNIAIGAFALMRGAGPLNRWVVDGMKNGFTGRGHFGAACWLGVQLPLGVLLGLAINYFVLKFLFFAGPIYGIGLLDYLIAIEQANWPAMFIDWLR